MAILIAGVSAANLGLVYVSIAVSILAAVTLAVGVLLRRRELFGEAGAAPQRAEPGWAAGGTVRPAPVRPAAGDRDTAERGGRTEDTRADGEQPDGLAARLTKAGSGAAAVPASARWPASIAAKGAPAAARRDGEQTAGGERVARPPAARGDWAAREPAAREATGREPVPSGTTERGAGWPPRPGSGAGPGRPAESGRGERGRAAAARADRARTPPGRDRDQEAPARRRREQAARQRGEAAAGQQAQAFRLPPPSERVRARDGEPAEAGPSESGLPEPVSHDREAIPPPVPPDEEHDRGGRPVGTGAPAPWARVVPPYVDDPAGRGRQLREPEKPAGPGEPDDAAARAGATAGTAADSAWSAWSSTGAGDQGTDAEAGRAGRGPADRDAADGDHAVRQAAAGAAAGAETGAAGETGDRAAEAGVPAEVGVDEADRAGPGGARSGEAERPGPGGAEPGEAERSGAEGPGETAGSTAEAGGEAAPASTGDAAATSKAAGAADAGDVGEGGVAGADADGSAPADDQVTVVPGVPRYHRRGCILIRFLSDGDLETSTRSAAEAAGSVPCKACQPDEPAASG